METEVLKEDIFNIPRILFAYLGESTLEASIKLLLYRALNFAVMFLMFWYIVLDFFRIEGDMYINVMQGIFYMAHVFLKYVLIIYFKYERETLVCSVTTKLQQFRNLTASEPIMKYFQTIQFIQQFVVIVAVVVLYLYVMRPLVNSSYFFVFESAIPKWLALDAILLLCHYYFAWLAFLVVFAYDLTYFVLCARIVLQVRLLKGEIQRVIDSENDRVKGEIWKYVGYHRALLLMYSQMKAMYSAMFLFHYFDTIITVCNDLFVLLRHVDLTVVLIKITSLTTLLAQFACYTISAEQIASEFADLSCALYSSKWYANSAKFQKLILFMMMKTQHVEYFSGAGIVDINADAFASVVRKSFSFYALMKNVLSK